MMNRPRSTARYACRGLLANSSLIAVAILLLGSAPLPTCAQSQVTTENIGGCTLKDHVYTCDGAAFQRALSSASNISIEAHNVDGVARAQLTAFITRKLGKTVVSSSGSANLSFLMIPTTSDDGVAYGSGLGTNGPGTDLGTLRIYTVAPDGSRGHLLWAETFTGNPYTPWPIVVRGLIAQFQSRFHIK